MLIPVSTCSICQDKIVTNARNDTVTALHCGHMYHTNCILTWFKQKNSKRECPHCRTKVPIPWTELRPVVFDIPENCFDDNAQNSIELASLKEELQEVKNETEIKVNQARDAVKSNYITIIKEWKQKLDKYDDIKNKLVKSERERKETESFSNKKIKELQTQLKHYQNREQATNYFSDLKNGKISNKYQRRI